MRLRVIDMLQGFSTRATPDGLRRGLDPQIGEGLRNVCEPRYVDRGRAPEYFGAIGRCRRSQMWRG